MRAAALFTSALAALALAVPGAASAGSLPDVAPVVVGTDAISDWGGGGDNAIVGHATGQDLDSASIALANDVVTFTMKVTFLPSTGGIPEATRYTWDFHVDATPGVDPEEGVSDAKFFELDGKWTNYSRGACDPTAGKCPPPRDPGTQPFALRGNCTTSTTGTNVTTCQELALYKATFTPASRTISIAVPAAVLGLKPCTTIEAGPNLFGGSVSASPSAFLSSSAAPLDFMDVSGYLQVPSTDPEVECGTPATPEVEG